MIDKVLTSYLDYICGKENVKEHEPMSTHTTFRIGGPARFFVTVQSKEVLLRLVSALKFIEYPYRIIGGGSNLLVVDGGFDGVIIKPVFRNIVDNGNFIYADAGVGLGAVVKFAAQKSLGGLEFAAGIPGTVGGAVFMNAGAHGGQIGDIVTMVDVLRDGEVVSMDARACKFAYRKSIFQSKRDLIILGAYFFLKPADPQHIETLITDYTTKRRAAQPNQPSAGSVFRNPPSLSAAQIIDQLGLKGTRIGGAQISEKHANFIINTGNATAADVQKLIRLIQKKVRATHNLTLRPEIEILK